MSCCPIASGGGDGSISGRIHVTGSPSAGSVQTPVDTPAGALFPCLGVYTIDGKACGIYGRLSPTPVVDYSAMDATVLIERTHEENLP